MPTRSSSVVAVYGEFVRKPYFVIVHSRPRAGHERFDQYVPDGLSELMLSTVGHLFAGHPELLEAMCKLDATNKGKSSHRTRRYVAKTRDELYSSDSSHLKALSVEYKGHWFGTNADKTQTREVIELACLAAGIPYQTVRKLPGFRGGANPSLQPTCYGLRPSHAAELKR